MRFLKLIALFIAILFYPLFAFAQVSTTTADQIDQTSEANAAREAANKEIQRQRDEFINSKMKLIPSVEEVRTSSIRDNLDIKVSPSNPGPDETIRVTIESYLTNLNKATISWAVNGKTIDRGTGKTSFSFQNGASGETTRLTITITTNTGERTTKELSWRPIGITMLWEADTYTPPFYRGKALVTSQARVRAIAIPDTANTRNSLSAGNLVYVWKQDGDAIPEASGYGKNSFTFLGPKPYGESNVRVTVSSIDDSMKSERRVDIPLAQPFILFYENHPLLGTWYGRALGTDLTLTKKEFSLNAEPYFFSNEVGEAPTLAYNWSLNGKAVQNIGRSITLRNETGEKGSSSLALAMRGLKQTFQTSGQSLLINFTPEEAARPTF